MKKPFTGVGTALVTPFQNGNVDRKALVHHVNRQITGGVDFLVPCGTTGESPTLDHGEHLDVIEMTVDSAAGRVPIMAGTGSNSTKEAVELTEGAKKAGASAVLTVFPYYNRPEPAGQLDYYRAIASCGLPVFLYDIPGRCGRMIDFDVLCRLADERTIAGMKWASGDRQQARDIIANTPDEFIMLSGDDANTLELIEMGGHGVISVTSNVVPTHMSVFVNLALSGDVNAKIDHDILKPLMKGLFTETNPQPVKTALAILYPEIFNEEFRSPIMPMRPDNRARLLDLLVNYGSTIYQ